MPIRSSLVYAALGFVAATLLLTLRVRPAPEPSFPRVRDAGRSQMRLKPLSWDLQDETVDESFPASDPPGNY